MLVTMILMVTMMFSSFERGTEMVQTNEVYSTSVCQMKSKTYSKEDYLFSQVLSNGDFVIVTANYEDSYRLIKSNGSIMPKAKFDSKHYAKVYVNGKELTEDDVRQMDSSTIRIYADLFRDWNDDIIRH